MWVRKTFLLFQVSSLALITSSKDVKDHCRYSDELLAHYAQTYRDREVYWVARERAKTCGDILVLIIDSYDKAKVTLPRWPFGRTPKKTLYESVRRTLVAMGIFLNYFHAHPCLFFVL